MIDFTFENPTRIHFGKNALSHLAAEVKRYGTRILLVYGGGSLKRIGLYEQIMTILNSENAQVWEISGVQPNPRLSLVRKGIEICRENDIQLVLAAGGGSAIDTAKAIVNGACYDGDPWDLVIRKAPITNALPVFSVLTASHNTFKSL